MPHTHWDREWYQPFQTFRMRLVELVDLLLTVMERDERLRFTLDGQVATVDDYLEVRPEAEPLLRRLIAEGRLAIGPWQILMDEFLVSGETIVRNLQLGWARAEALGRAMPIGYLPDMFGHVAQMPQILRRAGIERAVVWRGVPAQIGSNRFRWAAPDGSEVTAEYLVGGYGNGAHLFDVPGRLSARLLAYRAANVAFYGDRSLLAMYGTDHAVPTPRLADLVDEANASDSGVEIRIETLADYAAAADAGTGAAADRPQGGWTGELRSGARTNMLMGVNSARIDTKIACGRVERLLERYAEPLAALHGGPWPGRLLELAWRKVVDDSAHDSICGCSRDEVVAQVLTRFAEAEQIGEGIVEATARRIGERVGPGRWAVVNPSPEDRMDLVTLEIPVARDDEHWLAAHGRRLPAQELSRIEPFDARFSVRGDEVEGFIERRRHGRELFGRFINGFAVEPDAATPSITLFVDRLAEPPVLDVDEIVELVTAAASADPARTWDLAVRGPGRRRVAVCVHAPALGWSVVERSTERDTSGSSGEPGDPGDPAGGHGNGSGPEPAIEHPVALRDRSMWNGLVEVAVESVGTFSVRGGGVELAGVGRIVDGGDFGDSYDWAPPREDRLVQQPMAVAVEHGATGPLVAELVIRRDYAWPMGVEPSGERRAEAAVETAVLTRLELRADEPFVRVRIDFENRSRDHRVRFHIPLPSAAETSAAEGQYAVVERGLTIEGGHGEVPLPTFPARSFVSVEGVSALLDHVVEYELVDDGRELALTILRSFGLISRNDNPYREDPAGPEVPVPAAQLLGPWGFGFALMPHAGRWSDAGVLEAAERYRHPFVTVAGAQAAGVGPGAGLERGVEVPSAVAGLTVEGRGVVMTALRRAGAELELRLVAEHPSLTEAVVRGPFERARRVDLLGRDLEPLKVERSPTPERRPSPEGPAAIDRRGPTGLLRLRLGAWEIATVRLR